MATDDMQLFAKLIELRSISGAARQLGISKSGASRRLAALERRLGVKLVYRSSRAVRPTEAGLVYFQGCQRVLAEIARAEAEVSQLGDTLVGRLRVHGPHFLGGTWLSPALIAFLQRHLTLQGDLVLHDDYVDLIEELVDVAIRVSPLPDSSLVVRKLARIDRVLCASPAYLQQFGLIERWQDLEPHAWIVYSHQLEGDDRVQMSDRGQEVSARMRSRLRTNSAATIRGALLAGLGLCPVPRFVVSDALEDGRLQRVLPEVEFAPLWLAAMYPHTREVAAKVREFVDFLLHEWPPPAQLDASAWLGRSGDGGVPSGPDALR